MSSLRTLQIAKGASRLECLLIGSFAVLLAPWHASAQDPSPAHGGGSSALAVQDTPPKSPAEFNPDPGAWSHPAPPAAAEQVTDPLFPEQLPDLSLQPLPADQRLPRWGVFGRNPFRKVLSYHEYPLGREGLGVLPDSQPVTNRWELKLPHWSRYSDPVHETPYGYETPRLWHPYEQSRLKGDLPILGQDIFLNLMVKDFALFEFRRLPVGSGISAAAPNSSEFFGRGEQYFVSNDTSIAFDLFKGETAFKPVSWLVHVNYVHNENWLFVGENNLLDIDPRGTTYSDHYKAPDTSALQSFQAQGSNVNPVGSGPFRVTVNPPDAFNYLASKLQPTNGAQSLVKVDPNTQEASGTGSRGSSDPRYTERHREFDALQEAFTEVHLSDLSNNYDFISARFGIQPFVSDFRGFIFSDTNLGARLFGNADNNRLQYNLALFDMREKDTYSDLNEFNSRHQHVLVANLFRQDFLWPGYTTELSFHANLDNGDVHYDKNGFLTRPEPFGTVPVNGSGPLGHDVHAYYFGWAGDGHIGRLNLTHAFYEVVGEDRFNQLAGRPVEINAQMAALELSYDHDWYRLKLSGFYASGDAHPTDRVARGFDSIQDNPQFIGGPFSWYTHQGFNLAGTPVNLKQRDSLVPDLRTSKSEGQSNFVNPGVFIVGLGTDIDLTPKLKLFANVNYIWLAETAPIKLALETSRARNDLGLDASIGFRYRPFLTENVIFSAGIGTFFPGGGYRDIYRQNTVAVPGFTNQSDQGKVDKVLYNGFFTVTLLY